MYYSNIVLILLTMVASLIMLAYVVCKIPAKKGIIKKIQNLLDREVKITSFFLVVMIVGILILLSPDFVELALRETKEPEVTTKIYTIKEYMANELNGGKNAPDGKLTTLQDVDFDEKEYFEEIEKKYSGKVFYITYKEYILHLKKEDQ